MRIKKYSDDNSMLKISSSDSHIVDNNWKTTLIKLHWLAIERRIRYKITLLDRHCIAGMALEVLLELHRLVSLSTSFRLKLDHHNLMLFKKKPKAHLFQQS